MDEPELKVYGEFDGLGRPVAFYPTNVYRPQEDGTVNAAIPLKAVELTRAQWAEVLDNPGRRRWDYLLKKLTVFVPTEPMVSDVTSSGLTG